LSLVFHQLDAATPERLGALCAASDDPLRDMTLLRECLAEGTIRTEWCSSAEDSAGRLLASISWWAKPHTDVPMLVDVLSVVDSDAAAALIAHTRSRLGLVEAEAVLTYPKVGGEDRARWNELRAAALGQAGFSVAVDRVRIEWTGGEVPADSGRLRYAPARDQAEDRLVELFAVVGDGSLDHDMRLKRERYGREGEARRRLQRALGYRGDYDWFAVGMNNAGELVGYVISARVNGDRPILAEIGVSAAHRGHRYVDDLLAHGTGILADNGAERIRADTDNGNWPMRAAFQRGNYREFASRTDYAWRA
jgi:ribosomal protein S18 acetylase RimI-like enzyme